MACLALYHQGPKAEKRRRRRGKRAEPGTADKQEVAAPGAPEPLEVVREVVSEVTQLINAKAKIKYWSLPEIQGDEAWALKRPFSTWNDCCSVQRYNRLFTWETRGSTGLRFTEPTPTKTSETGRSLGRKRYILHRV